MVARPSKLPQTGRPLMQNLIKTHIKKEILPSYLSWGTEQTAPAPPPASQVTQPSSLHLGTLGSWRIPGTEKSLALGKPLSLSQPLPFPINAAIQRTYIVLLKPATLQKKEVKKKEVKTLLGWGRGEQQQRSADRAGSQQPHLSPAGMLPADRARSNSRGTPGVAPQMETKQDPDTGLEASWKGSEHHESAAKQEPPLLSWVLGSSGTPGAARGTPCSTHGGLTPGEHMAHHALLLINLDLPHAKHMLRPRVCSGPAYETWRVIGKTL